MRLNPVSHPAKRRTVQFDYDTDLQVRVDRKLATAVNTMWRGPQLRVAPAVRGAGLSPFEILVLATGSMADVVTLVIARDELLLYAKHLWSHLSRAEAPTELRLEYRKGAKRMSLRVSTDEVNDISKPLMELLTALE